MIWFSVACAGLGLGLLVGEWLWRRKHAPFRDDERGDTPRDW